MNRQATNKTYILFSFFCLIFSLAHAQPTATRFIPSANKNISYMGRVGITDSCAEFFWTGSSVQLNVKGTGTVKALLADTEGNNYYYVIVDGDESKAKKIKIDKEKKFYTLVNNLDKGTHNINLFKVTNTDAKRTMFYGFETDASARIYKASKKLKRKIEFFGNSITCGHGVEDSIRDSGAPEYFNNYRAYGAIAARHFNAQYHCTAKSGIGVTVSWFPEVMPDIYDRLNPIDSNSKWNFSNYVPNIVVVNLLQNDSWIVNMPDNEQFKARFGNLKPSEEFIIDAYKNFIQSIRSKYPKATIICALGTMDATRQGSKWPAYVDAAVASLKDKKIVTHFFPYKNIPGHPKIKEQQAMADDLISFINKNKLWK